MNSLAQYVAPASVAEIHLYHPQPFRDAEKKLRRLLTPEFLALVHRSLIAGGLVVLQTDNKAYWQYLRRLCRYCSSWRSRAADGPMHREAVRAREIYARRHGMRIFRGSGPAAPELTAERIEQLVVAAPRPNFSA